MRERVCVCVKGEIDRDRKKRKRDISRKGYYWYDKYVSHELMLVTRNGQATLEAGPLQQFIGILRPKSARPLSKKGHDIIVYSYSSSHFFVVYARHQRETLSQI